MVGGSSSLSMVEVDQTVREIKAMVEVPVILFPSGAGVVSPAADAIFFMSLLNSRLPRYLIREQKQAAPLLREAKLEPIPMGYLVVERGMRVGEVGKADLIPRHDTNEAVRYALAAQYLGMAIIYLEAGSGAPESVPTAMVTAVRQAVSILVAVGGGIQKPEQASAIAAAGADIIVTGTIVEREEGVEDALAQVISAVKT
jgi:phosphoglycerol geranylgeranyltransferase